MWKYIRRKRKEEKKKIMTSRLAKNRQSVKTGPGYQGCLLMTIIGTSASDILLAYCLVFCFKRLKECLSKKTQKGETHESNGSNKRESDIPCPGKVRSLHGI